MNRTNKQENMYNIRNQTANIWVSYKKLLIQQKHEKRNINLARQTCIHAILCISGPKQHCDKDHKKRTVWLYFRVSLVYYFRAQRIILHLSFVFCVSIRMESFMIRVSYKHFLIPQSINDSNQLHYVIHTLKY